MGQDRVIRNQILGERVHVHCEDPQSAGSVHAVRNQPPLLVQHPGAQQGHQRDKTHPLPQQIVLHHHRHTLQGIWFHSYLISNHPDIPHHRPEQVRALPGNTPVLGQPEPVDRN